MLQYDSSLFLQNPEILFCINLVLLRTTDSGAADKFDASILPLVNQARLPLVHKFALCWSGKARMLKNLRRGGFWNKHFHEEY